MCRERLDVLVLVEEKDDVVVVEKEEEDADNGEL